MASMRRDKPFLICVHPELLAKYLHLSQHRTSVLFQMENAADSVERALPEGETRGASDWDELMRSIIEARLLRKDRHYRLARNLYEEVLTGAKATFASVTSPGVFNTDDEVRQVSVDLILALQTIENGTVSQISQTTVENAVVLADWLVRESERVAQVLSPKSPVVTDHTL
jgi:hypothetical protein